MSAVCNGNGWLDDNADGNCSRCEGCDACRGRDARQPMVGPMHKRDVVRLTDSQIEDELAALGKLFEDSRSDGEGHGGSPGEWMVERMGELETEQKRRVPQRRRKGG